METGRCSLHSFARRIVVNFLSIIQIHWTSLVRAVSSDRPNVGLIDAILLRRNGSTAFSPFSLRDVRRVFP